MEQTAATSAWFKGPDLQTSVEHSDSGPRLLNGHNARSLPPELWCKIWEQLSFSDCVFVTHVCSQWRAVALDYPALWSRVTFYTSRSRIWRREVASEDDSDGVSAIPAGWKNSPYRTHSTNVYAADVLLSRSRAVPLHITLDIVPFHAQTRVLVDLAASLAQHAHRLVSLRIRAANSDPLDAFMAKLGSLPVLRFLSGNTMPNTKGRISMSPFAPPNWASAAPLLEVLELRDGFLWPDPDDEPDSFDNIKSLLIAPTFDLDDELLAALAGCPNVQDLHVDLCNMESVPDPIVDQATTQELNMLASRIPRVTVANVHATYEAWAIAAFGVTSRRPYLALEYASLAALDGGSQILCHCSLDSDNGPLHLAFAFVPAQESIEATVSDAAGHTRRITVGQWENTTVCLARLRLETFWDRVASLALDAALWPDCMEAMPQGDCNIAHLEFVVGEERQRLFTAVRSELAMATGERCAMPLKTLTLRRARTGNRMSADDIALLVRHVALVTGTRAARLRKLTVDSLLLGGRSTVTLSDLADCVVVEAL